MISRLKEKLRDPDYRKAFLASQINIGIPSQIRAMMKSRRWTQGTLVERTGSSMRQPRVSGLMTPGKTRPNIETLRRLAEAFDCGLMIRFAPFSELARWSEEFEPESFYVPQFDEDAGFLDHKPVTSQSFLEKAVETTGTQDCFRVKSTPQVVGSVLQSGSKVVSISTANVQETLYGR